MRHAVVRRAMMIGMVWSVAAATASHVHAQVAVVSTDRIVASPAVSVLDRPVTVQLDNVSLKAAVKAIASSADVRVQYQGNQLDATNAPITLHAAKMPLGMALSRVLAGTTLSAVALDRDLVGIQALADVERAPQGAVTGKVVHAKTRVPIVGATILVDDATKGVKTSEDGTFRLAAATGTHTIHVRALGFVRQSQQVTVSESQSATVEIALEPSASVLDEVIVTGTVVATERKAISTPITVITAEDIQKRGITRVEQLFRGEIPGVVALDLGSLKYNGQVVNGVEDTLGKMVSSQVYARGSASLDYFAGSNPLKTFIDGVELLDPGMLGTIDPQSIERIEVITGPQAATIYGSGAMGGVMQIFTKKGNGGATPELIARLKYGILQNSLNDGLTPSHNDALNLMGSGGPQFSYSGNLSYTYSGQWLPKLFTRTYGASVGATHTRGPFTASGTVSLTTSKNGTFGEGTGVASSPMELELQESGQNTGRNRAAYYMQRISLAASQTMSLNIDYRMTPSWQHHATLGRNQTKFELIPQAPTFELPNDTLFSTSSATGQRTTLGYNTTVISPRISVLQSTLTLGANGSMGDQVSFTGCKVTKSSTAFVPCRYWSSVDLNQTIDDKSWGGFGSWQLGVADRLYFTFGLRGEYNPFYGTEHKIDWTPTNGVAYSMEYGQVTLKLMASYGKATRPPGESMRRQIVTSMPGFSPGSYVSQVANPTLTPEYSHGPQGGFELYFGNLGSLTINRYQQTVTNLIESAYVDTIPATCLGLPTCNPAITDWAFYSTQYRNTASIRQHGWESTGSLNFGPISLKGTYSWNDSRILSSEVEWYYRGMSFYGMPTHSGNATIGYSRGGTTVNYSLNYVGSQVRYMTDVTAVLAIDNLARLQMYRNRRVNANPWGTQPGYAKADITATQRLSSWASATLNIMNVGNSFTSDATVGFPTLGRQTLLGLTMRFPR